MDSPEIIPNPKNAWPFDLGKKHPDAWIEMSEEHATYSLEVLPPIYFRGGFAVSEPAWHNEHDEPVYWCVVKAGSKHYGRHLTVREAPAAALALKAVAE